MMTRLSRSLVCAALLSLGTFACTVTAPQPGTGASTSTPGSTRKPSKQADANSLKALATDTPPDGSSLVGKKSKPTAGGSTIPIVDVDVYLVTIDFDDDGADDELYWAHTEDGVTYIWWEGSVICADGLSDGTGGFLMDIGPDGSGSYMFALDECPEQNRYGCEFDANGEETVCGDCEWDAEQISCVGVE